MQCQCIECSSKDIEAGRIDFERDDDEGPIMFERMPLIVEDPPESVGGEVHTLSDGHDIESATAPSDTCLLALEAEVVSDQNDIEDRVQARVREEADTMADEIQRRMMAGQSAKANWWMLTSPVLGGNIQKPSVLQ